MNFFTGLLDSQWGVILMVSGAVFMSVLAIMLLLYGFFDPVRLRLKREMDSGEVSVKSDSILSKKLRQHDNIFIPSDEELAQKTAARLHHGGFHGKNALLYYYAIRMSLMLFLPFFALIVSSSVPQIKSDLVFLIVLVALGIAYVAPSFTLDKLIATRQKNIRRAFPEALDLLVVCSEAGLSLDSAIQKVAVEISIGQPVLANELNIVILETRAGVDRHKALQRMVERTGVEDIKGLIATLAQSMRFGTGISESLKVYSEDLRDKRMQAAEEMAAKIGVKLIFPLGFCLLPAFMLVILLPSVLVFQSIK
jgi:tight adherence protein C